MHTCRHTHTSTHAHSCIQIIVMNFYHAHILRNLSSEAQQTRIIKLDHEQGHANCYSNMPDNLIHNYIAYTVSHPLSSDSDINECESPSVKCMHRCENTDGSYHCFCHDGFELAPDGSTCQGTCFITTVVTRHLCKNVLIVCMHTIGVELLCWSSWQ